MNRKEKTENFWNKLDSSLESMVLVPNPKEIDLLEKKEILSYLPDYKEKDLLELAAGIGRYTGQFAKDAKSVTATDLIPKFVQTNKTLHKDFKNIKYIAKDATELTFKASSFDLIFINWLFMYLDDTELEPLSAKLHTWLKHEGHIFVRESCRIPEYRRNDHYYVNYRNFHTYTNTFKKKFNIIREGNIKNSEIHFSDPFQCFWLLQKK